MTKTCIILEKQMNPKQWRYRIYVLNLPFKKAGEYTFTDGTNLRIVSEQVKNEYLRPILESSRKRGLQVIGKMDNIGDAAKAMIVLENVDAIMTGKKAEIADPFGSLLTM